jgi:DedD protein
MQDDAFHEIQLNGKQLVFLFMAATVVAVVIFLCGVMVGRGVPQRAGDVTEVPIETAAIVPVRAAEPVAEKPRPVAAVSTPASPAPAPAPPPPAPIAAAKPVPPPPAPIAASASKEPAGVGFVVQVAAVKERGEADTIARRLSTKGYPAFVTTAPGGVQMFRVRVGKFPDRREAETIAGRLEKEEQFKPWITR